VPEAGMTLASDYEVEHYLDHQAAIFLARFDPGTYLYLSRVMDYYDPFGQDYSRLPDTRYLLVSFSSDWRFGTGQLPAGPEQSGGPVGRKARTVYFRRMFHACANSGGSAGFVACGRPRGCPGTAGLD
jgi:hypothetical protein